jgi:hypothetical protein
VVYQDCAKFDDGQRLFRFKQVICQILKVIGAYFKLVPMIYGILFGRNGHKILTIQLLLDYTLNVRETIENMSMKIRKTAAFGWEDCFALTTGSVELIATADIGLRIISFE